MTSHQDRLLSKGRRAAEARLREIDRRLAREAHEQALRDTRTEHAELRRLEERVKYRALLILPAKTFKDRWERQRAIADDIVLPQHREAVEHWRRHVEDLARARGISIVYGVFKGQNAYAWPSTKRVELSSVNGPEAYAAALHEIGHCANPCQPAHRRVSSGRGTACVECELTAWRWAMVTAQPWLREMHVGMSVVLPSYRPLGTPSEQAAIDRLCSVSTYHATRMQAAGL